jgi:hypothetical protein
MPRKAPGVVAAVVAVVWLCVAVQAESRVPPEEKEIKPTRQWSGSIADENLAGEAKSCITSAKELEALWKAWKIEEKMPEIDFTKEFVAVVTTRGSRLNVSGRLDAATGDFTVVGISTKDLRPGFRYVVAAFSREGVMKVNGKELK